MQGPKPAPPPRRTPPPTRAPPSARARLLIESFPDAYSIWCGTISRDFFPTYTLESTCGSPKHSPYRPFNAQTPVSYPILYSPKPDVANVPLDAARVPEAGVRPKMPSTAPAARAATSARCGGVRSCHEAHMGKLGASKRPVGGAGRARAGPDLGTDAPLCVFQVPYCLYSVCERSPRSISN